MTFAAPPRTCPACSYEDYLDSQINATDVYYLEDVELARHLVELGCVALAGVKCGWSSDRRLRRSVHMCRAVAVYSSLSARVRDQTLLGTVTTARVDVRALWLLPRGNGGQHKSSEAPLPPPTPPHTLPPSLSLPVPIHP